MRLPALATATLPSRHRVFCTRPAEVPLLMKQTAPYFRHGITLAAGDWVLDVGANIGLFSLQASEWGRRPLNGLAIEAAPALAHALQANLAAHAPAPSLPGHVGLRAVACAAGAAQGEIEFNYFPRATMLSTAHPQALLGRTMRDQIAEELAHLPARWRFLARCPQAVRRALVGLALKLWLRPRLHRCPVRTLSDLIEAHAVPRVDLLKIDVEHAELDVLRGLSDAHWPGVRQVVMEVHDVHGRLAHVLALLRRHGLGRIVHAQSPALARFGVWQVWAMRGVG